MSHATACFRSDGEWFCARDCTHERDEYVSGLERKVKDAARLLREVSKTVSGYRDEKCACSHCVGADLTLRNVDQLLALLET